ncbi:MAG: hypothetical protein ACK40X_15035, partial [Armatimonadota bacterium]
WQSQPLTGETVADLKTFAQRKEIERCASRRLQTDFATLRQLIEQADITEQPKTQLLRRLNELDNTMPKTFRVDEPAAFQTRLPLNDWHAQLFQVQAQLWQLKGIRAFSAFIASSPYDPLPYLTENPLPKVLQRRAEITLLRNEVRPIAINIVNAREHPVTVQVRVEGLPKTVIVEPHYAVWTDTREGAPVAAALPEGVKFTVAAGMVGQAWLNIKPKKQVLKGEYEGRIILTTDIGDRVQIPLRL